MPCRPSSRVFSNFGFELHMLRTEYHPRFLKFKKKKLVATCTDQNRNDWFPFTIDDYGLGCRYSSQEYDVKS